MKKLKAIWQIITSDAFTLITDHGKDYSYMSYGMSLKQAKDRVAEVEEVIISEVQIENQLKEILK